MLTEIIKTLVKDMENREEDACDIMLTDGSSLYQRLCVALGSAAVLDGNINIDELLNSD